MHHILERSGTRKQTMRGTKKAITLEISRQWKEAERLWGPIPEALRETLELLISRYRLSVTIGDLLVLNGRWYVTHAGLLSIARTKRCFGMRVVPAKEFCDPTKGRYAFCATVYKSPTCEGFTGYGDADPSNVSELMHGAELRIAETRAVNRALRKAYGIGVCSVEEIGFVAPLATTQRQSARCGSFLQNPRMVIAIMGTAVTGTLPAFGFAIASAR
jgi:hypothetical protein